MARVPLQDENSMPQAAALVDQIKAERGRLLNLYKVLLNSPEVCAGWLKLFTAIRQKGKLSDRWRELAIMRVAVINGAPYEYQAHVPFALKAGLEQKQLDQLERWRESGLYDANDSAILAYTDAMTREIRVPDALVAQLKGFLDDRELVELTATVAGYNMVSRFLEAMKVDHDHR